MKSLRLGLVIDELYRSEPRQKVFALSRDEAERLPRLPTVAVISITAPERPPASLDGFEHLMRLSFADVDHLSTGLSAKAQEHVAQAFTPAQAEHVLSFVNALPPSVLSIVVHCEGGYSRSCAVAYVLQELYGYVAEIDRLHQANKSVIKLLRQAAAEHTVLSDEKGDDMQ